jgi:hypothetical protein
MAKSLKSQGRVEVAVLLRRARRQLALGRITEQDATFIVERLLEIDKRIVRMDELNEHGEPEEIVNSASESKGHHSEASHP